MERSLLRPPMRQRSGAPSNTPELIPSRKMEQAMASDFGSPDEQAGNELAERSQYGRQRKATETRDA